MNALVLDGSLRLDSRRPDPIPADGEALLRIRQAGICSTDLHTARGTSGFRGVLGHEFVAEVIQATDAKLIGKRVVGEISCVCGRCDLCMTGLSNHCRNRTALGMVGRDGCFAELLRMPASNLHLVPDSIDDDAAVFVEPLAAAFQIRKQLGAALTAKTWVTVLGDGRLGLLVGQVLHEAGCAVRVVGRHEKKLALCEKWGIKSRLVDDLRPRADQDVVVDCTGSATGFATAVAMCRPRGVLVLKSTASEAKAMNLSPVVINEITLVGSRSGPFKPALKALEERRIDVHPLISRRMKLADGVEALRVAASPGILKVVLSP